MFKRSNSKLSHLFIDFVLCRDDAAAKQRILVLTSQSYHASGYTNILQLNVVQQHFNALKCNSIQPSWLEQLAEALALLQGNVDCLPIRINDVGTTVLCLERFACNFQSYHHGGSALTYQKTAI